jgi:hypothetical protein
MLARSSANVCLLSAIIFVSVGCFTQSLKTGSPPSISDSEIPAVAEATVTTIDSQRASSPDSLPENQAPGIITIGNDQGGRLVEYALSKAKLADTNTQIRFAGNCASGCTLYLTLPADQTCILPGASFTFHLHVSSKDRARRAARAYLENVYPSWVMAWLEAHGGLSSRELRMNYQHASRYLRPC